ncbi:MAG: alpha/beta fold hydrolase, partial [Deltaproteobacteria bacterium]
MSKPTIEEGIVKPGPAGLRYRIEGAAGNVVVTFVHGLAATLDVWEGQARRLADDYRVLRYDLRSHGGSEAADVPCTRSDLAAELVGLLDALGIERSVIVGHSAGGVIAMQAAVDHPARGAGLVLVGTASECNDKTAAWYEKTAAKARESGGAAALRAMGMPEGSPAPDGPGFGHLALAMRSLNADPLTERLRSLDVPVLIIVGERDFLGVGGSVILHRAIAC